MWRISNNPEYGNCFTFNAIYNIDSSENVSEALEVTMTGGSATLSMVLFLDQRFYTPLSLSKEAGVRITVHNPQVNPMTEEYGINLKPNTASNIGIQQVLFVDRFFSTYFKLHLSLIYSLAFNFEKTKPVSI